MIRERLILSQSCFDIFDRAYSHACITKLEKDTDCPSISFSIRSTNARGKRIVLFSATKNKIYVLIITLNVLKITSLLRYSEDNLNILLSYIWRGETDDKRGTKRRKSQR